MKVDSWVLGGLHLGMPVSGSFYFCLLRSSSVTSIPGLQRLSLPSTKLFPCLLSAHHPAFSTESVGPNCPTHEINSRSYSLISCCLPATGLSTLCIMLFTSQWTYEMAIILLLTLSSRIGFSEHGPETVSLSTKLPDHTVWEEMRFCFSVSMTDNC